jgi:pimeloyl-ACP methyl ester carboxylesterase
MQLKNLFLALLIGAAQNVHAQSIPYGDNPAAGGYVNVGDAKLYYEVYGKGQPLVMLHGGVFGSIGEFEYLIPKLAEHYQVICIATRGHGKSEVGKEPFTWKQRAEDAYTVTRHLTKDSVIVVGFSDGGGAGLALAALHPELVKRLVAMGVGDHPAGHPKEAAYTPAGLMKIDSGFFASRLKLMPEPARWGEMLEKCNHLYNDENQSQETFSKIKCPVLVMVGDRDGYNNIDVAVKCAKYIPDHQLAVIPGCDHVILYCNFPAVWESMKPFVLH